MRYLRICCATFLLPLMLLTAIGASARPAQSELGGAGTINGSGEGEYLGTAELMIGGVPRPAMVRLTLETPFAPDSDGQLTASGVYLFEFDNGDSITTAPARIVLSATAVANRLAMNASLGIAAGTGAYEGLRGDLLQQGEMSSDRTEATFHLAGTIDQ